MRGVLGTILAITTLSLHTMCKAKDDTVTLKRSEGSNPDLLIQIKRSPCFRTCPVDLIQLYTDRSIKYKGIKHIDKIGSFSAIVSSAQYDSITAYIDQIEHLDSNKNKYVMELVMDLPSRTLTINDLKITYQLSEAPDEIINLDKYIYDILTELTFTKIREFTN